MTSFARNPKILIAVGVLAVAACYMMLLRPQGAELASVKADRQAAETKLATAATTSTTTKGAGSAASAAENNRKTLDLAVPPQIRLAEVLRQLDSVARSSGVRQSTITPAETTSLAGGAGSSAQITVSATGSRAAIETYLQQLSSLDRLFVSEQVSIQDVVQSQTPGAAAPGAAAPSGEVQLQLTGRVLSTFTTTTTAAASTGSGAGSPATTAKSS
jgi:Tfp pilus assembly protein PilO